MTFLRKLLILCLCSMTLGAPAARAQDNAVLGMVLDVQGNGELARKDSNSKLQLLTYLKAGEHIRLEAGAKASVSHYGVKLIYQLTGPLQAKVETSGIQVISGAPAVTKSLAEKTVLAALNPSTGSAAYRMRSLHEITLLGPKKDTAVMQLRPRFRWEANEATVYTLTLLDANGQQMAQARTEQTSWKLPADKTLAYGQAYQWTVSYTSAVDQQPRQAVAPFSVIQESERNNLLAMRPGLDAGIDEWVLYASLLQDRRLLEDARDIWRDVAARRPDLVKAGNLAR